MSIKNDKLSTNSEEIDNVKFAYNNGLCLTKELTGAKFNSSS